MSQLLYAQLHRPTTPNPPAVQVNQETLERLVHIPDLDSRDMKYIEDRAHKLDLDQKAKAEAIVNTHEFRTWLVSPSSSKLLIHGHMSGTKTFSALSLFCTNLMTSLRDREGFYSLIFFCGLHLDTDGDENEEAYVGGVSMIKSLIAQLLRCHSFNTWSLPHELNPFDFPENNMEKLCGLFGWLLHQIPRSITLVCLIDGIEYYERDAYLADMSTALAYILSLTLDNTMNAPFKVLVTSPRQTSLVRKPFENESDGGEILSLKAKSGTGGRLDHSRLQRRLEQGLQGN